MTNQKPLEIRKRICVKCGDFYPSKMRFSKLCSKCSKTNKNKLKKRVYRLKR